MMSEWVTIATFTQAMDAHLLKTKLEAEGIEVFIADEFAIGVHPFYSNALGGVKVQVRSQDQERVQAILCTDESGLHGGQSGGLSEVVCPSCQSRDVSFREVRPLWAWLPISRKKWLCGSCGYGWRAD